ncbi:MAG: c-type cytochrome [Candidatus Tectomicrobia bacterium]|nr:c-type cytochrome [Candidatus Tectomicrobia bacterium]
MKGRWGGILLPCLALGMVLLFGLPAYGQSDAALVERGRYIVTALNGCGCHTQLDRQGRPIKEKFLAGAPEQPPRLGPPQNTGWAQPSGWRIFASNLTPDQETGLGKWTEQDFMRLMRSGVRPDGKRVDPFMAWPDYQGMTDADLKAIYAYLRTIAPIKNKAPASMRVKK